jgi:hypothetical protein
LFWAGGRREPLTDFYRMLRNLSISLGTDGHAGGYLS